MRNRKKRLLLLMLTMLVLWGCGKKETVLPNEPMSDAANEEYQQETKEMIMEIGYQKSVSIDRNQDGTAEEISILEDTEDSEGMRELLIQIEEEKTAVGKYMDYGMAVLIRQEDGTLLLLLQGNILTMNPITMLYDLTEGKPKLCDRIEMGIDYGGVTQDGIRLVQIAHILGTYTMGKQYTISDEKKLITEDTVFSFDNGEKASPRVSLTLKKELSVLLEKDGKEEKAILSAGTVIYPSGTDNQEYFWFITEDGREGKLLFEIKKENDMPICYINGTSEYDLFETLPYAG